MEMTTFRDLEMVQFTQRKHTLDDARRLSVIKLSSPSIFHSNHTTCSCSREWDFLLSSNEKRLNKSHRNFISLHVLTRIFCVQFLKVKTERRKKLLFVINLAFLEGNTATNTVPKKLNGE